MSAPWAALVVSVGFIAGIACGAWVRREHKALERATTWTGTSYDDPRARSL